MQKFYFDTSIWLDLLENRNEPNMPKGDWARHLLNKITKENDIIVYSDLILLELNSAGYSIFELEEIFRKLKDITYFVESTEKQVRRAKDFAAKRNIPKKDALHALIARDSRAILITLDKHFRKLTDIAIVKRPQDII